MNQTQTLSLDLVEVDNSLNPRSGALDQITVMEYAANIDDLPPMKVARQIDGKFLLIAGFHRIAAHRLANRDTGQFEVIECDREQAEEIADLDNLVHGIQLTRAEKREVYKRQIKRYPEWSDSRLAHHCMTTDKTIRSVREELEASSEIPRIDILEGADGIKRPRTVPREKPEPDNRTMTLNLTELPAYPPGKGMKLTEIKPIPEKDPEPEKPKGELELGPMSDLILTLRVKMDKRFDRRNVLISLTYSGEEPLIMKSVDYAGVTDEVSLLLTEYGPPIGVVENTEGGGNDEEPGEIPESVPEWMDR